MTRVLVNGAAGKMGRGAVEAIRHDPALKLVGETGRQDDLVAAIHATQAQVVLDVTTASAVFENACKIMDAGAYPVIGTSGLLEAQVQQLVARCAEKKQAGLIVPNFSIGAVLAMQYAQDCARYFSSVEIIELHHHQKADAPSGTAIRTAERIAQVKAKSPPAQREEKEIVQGARGALYKDIPIHSVRLPGLLAHQMVLLGDAGELVTIKHDVMSRAAYMPGICLACARVMQLDGLYYGLEHVLERGRYS